MSQVPPYGDTFSIIDLAMVFVNVLKNELCTTQASNVGPHLR